MNLCSTLSFIILIEALFKIHLAKTTTDISNTTLGFSYYYILVIDVILGLCFPTMFHFVDTGGFPFLVFRGLVL